MSSELNLLCDQEADAFSFPRLMQLDDIRMVLYTSVSQSKFEIPDEDNTLTSPIRIVISFLNDS